MSQAAIVAGLYVALTIASSATAFGVLNFRVSEILTILPIFMPSSVLGLTVGCFISNMLSFSMWDMLFGTLATLIASLLTYSLRNVKIKGSHILALLPPVIVNALIVGAEITYLLTPGPATVEVLFINMLMVGWGQTIICIFLGLPLTMLIERNRVLKSFVSR